MSRTIHIAMSLDGYIADSQGSIAWLEQAATNPDISKRVLAFIDASEVIVMGRLTYQHVLGFGTWPYSDKTTIVVSGTLTKSDSPDTVIVRKDQIFAALLLSRAQNIWIAGGGQLNSYMLEQGLVDTLIVTVVPILLGSGIPIFAPMNGPTPLRLLEICPLPDGFVELSYGLSLPG